MPETKSASSSRWQKINKLSSAARNQGLILLKKTKLFKAKPAEKEAAKEAAKIDKQLIFSLRNSSFPSFKQLKYLGQFLSRPEKKVMQICLAIIALNFVWLGWLFYQKNVEVAPDSGGSYTEALTGAPKLINPLYSSINNVDNDLVTLVYSGLLKKDKGNNLIPDLAEKFEVSADSKTYTFTLKKDFVWQDKTPCTSDDVVFTFQAIKNPEYKSPWRASFTGVEVTSIDERTVKFTLAEPYAAFLELLTIGILPSHIWQTITPAAAPLADLNLKPIGNGPYQFKSLTKDKSGQIKSYELEASPLYFGRPPYINTLIFKFFPTFTEGVAALNDGKVEGIDYLPRGYEDELAGKANLNRYYLLQPQLNAIFFNQNNLGTLKDIKVRQALAYALDKKAIAARFPQAQIIDSPILPMLTNYLNPKITKYGFDIARAQQLLDENGWKITEVKEENVMGATSTPPLNPPAGQWRKKGNEFLTLTLTTVDQPDTVQSAELIKQAWGQLNILATLNIVSSSLVQAEVIRPRNFQVLLYGLVLSSDPDQYPFWHSSQIGPGGLNLANYNNKEADILLEDARLTTKTEARQEKYNKFQEIIARDLPALFLFSQSYPYVQDSKIKGFDTTAIGISSDRFANIVNWYINTRKKINW